MMENGEHEELIKLSKLNEAYGRDSLMPEALNHFETMVSDTASVSMIEPLMDHVIENYGYEYVEDYLTTILGVFRTSRNGPGIPIDITTKIIMNNDLADVQRYFDMGERLGGQALVDKLLGGTHNLFLSLLLTAASGRKADIVYHALQRLSPEARTEAYTRLPEEWKSFAEKETPKHRFFLTHTEGLSRWLAVTGDLPPYPPRRNKLSDHLMFYRDNHLLEHESPYRFKRKLYDEILPAMLFAAQTEGFTMPETSAASYAFKLATLFSSEDDIDAYLRKFALTWGKDAKNLLHDACLFELPKDGRWNAKKWQKLVMAYGPAVYPLIQSAVNIEGNMEDEPFPETLEQLNSFVLKINYGRKYENEKLAHLCARYGLSEDDFETLLDWTSQNGKKQDFLPTIRIDGADIGFPDFYMERLPPDDPLGFFLGEVTNSCQSVIGNGRDCAFHGMANPYSGFYVWRKKTDGIITEVDPIIAESWVWLGQNNAMVFDSFERLKVEYNELVQPFLEQFAHEVANKYEFQDGNGTHIISDIRLGCDPSGQTPPLSLSKISDPVGPRNYQGKYLSDGAPARDSASQYVIAPIDHRAMAAPKLPVAMFSEKAYEAGVKYLSLVEKKLDQQFGVNAEIAIELEFYAAALDSKLTSEIPVQQMQSDMADAGLNFRIIQGDPETRFGQHRLISSFGSPVEVVRTTQAARKFLREKAKQFNLAAVRFQPRPYKGWEWSSASIFASLNAKDGASILADAMGHLTVQGEDIISNLVTFNRHAFLAYAQQDIDYARFWNSGFAPSMIGFGPDRSASFGLSNSASRGGLIENRLANANCNLVSSAAATLAGIEYALTNTRPLIEPTSAACDAIPMNGYPIPANRYEALAALKEGISGGLFKGAAGEVFKTIAQQHEDSTRNDPAIAQAQQQLAPQ